MINLNAISVPSYAYDFKKQILLVFDGKEVVVDGGDKIRKVWAAQSNLSFLKAVKPLSFWSPSETEARSIHIFARVGVWVYRFSRLDYTLTKRRGKGDLPTGSFYSPDDLGLLSNFWFISLDEAWNA